MMKSTYRPIGMSKPFSNGTFKELTLGERSWAIGILLALPPSSPMICTTRKEVLVYQEPNHPLFRIYNHHLSLALVPFVSLQRASYSSSGIHNFVSTMSTCKASNLLGLQKQLWKLILIHSSAYFLIQGFRSGFHDRKHNVTQVGYFKYFSASRKVSKFVL